MPIVTVNDERTRTFGGITLAPGENEVSEEILAILNAHPVFVDKLKSKIFGLPEVKPVANPEPEPEPEPIKPAKPSKQKGK